jgi:hypothetical protein
MNSLTVSLKRATVTYDVTLQYATISSITDLIFDSRKVIHVLKQKLGQNHNVNVANRYPENLATIDVERHRQIKTTCAKTMRADLVHWTASCH